MEDADLTAIEYDQNHNLKEQCYQGLCKWKEQEKEGATIEKLIGGLRKSEINAVAGRCQTFVILQYMHPSIRILNYPPQAFT